MDISKNAVKYELQRYSTSYSRSNRNGYESTKFVNIKDINHEPEKQIITYTDSPHSNFSGEITDGSIIGYTYRVRAYYLDGNYTTVYWSNEYTVYNPLYLETPTLVATVVTDPSNPTSKQRSVLLSWTGSSKPKVIYEIYRSLTPNDDYKNIGVVTEKTNYSDILVTSDKYYYKVKAVLADREEFKSNFLNVVSVFMSSLFSLYKESTTVVPLRIDPIILDLNGNGLNTVDMNEGVYFDLNADGFAQLTGWTAPGCGILVWDRNNDGIINNGRELWGNETLLKNGIIASSGFRALEEYDDNGDGLIDESDAIYSKLGVWNDINQNGITEPGELYTLPDLEIDSIKLLSFGKGRSNILLWKSIYTKFDETEYEIGEFLFENDPFY